MQNTFSGLLQQVNDTRLRFEALTEEVNKDRQRTSALEARVSATEEELQFLNELLEVHEGLDEAKDRALFSFSSFLCFFPYLPWLTG